MNLKIMKNQAPLSHTTHCSYAYTSLHVVKLYLLKVLGKCYEWENDSVHV